MRSVMTGAEQFGRYRWHTLRAPGVADPTGARETDSNEGGVTADLIREERTFKVTNRPISVCLSALRAGGRAEARLTTLLSSGGDGAAPN